MIATHRYLPPKTVLSRSHTYLRVHYHTADIHTSYIYMMPFSAKLNEFELHVHVDEDQFSKQIDNLTSTYRQLHVVPRKFVAASNSRV